MRTRATIISMALAAVHLLLTSGCASIVSGRKASIAIDSYPSNAHVVIHDKSGQEVASVNTPGVVSLDRNGRWFMPARYTATIEAPGYQTAEVPIHSTINPWILGNVVVGGIPGLVVDNATGACWKPNQDSIHQQLMPMAYAQQPPGYPPNPVASQASCQVPFAPPQQTVMNSGPPVSPPPASEASWPANGTTPYAPANPAVARCPSAPPSSPTGSFYR
jgi:uncharacterized protein YceK